MSIPGRYIALEGSDGSGKSTHAKLLAEALGAVRTREPGATNFGKHLREMLLYCPPDIKPVPRAEALLFAADRAQHIAEVVAPALGAGRHVVTERSYGSTLAFQGYGSGLPIDELRDLINFASARPMDASASLNDVILPDVVVWLDAPMCTSDQRVHNWDRMKGEQRSLLDAGEAEQIPLLEEVAARTQFEERIRPRNGRTPDRFEMEGLEFTHRVWQSYRKLCEAEPERWVQVDATGSIDEVAARVLEAVQAHPAMSD